MEKIKRLGLYQKGILLFLTVMTLVFAVVYSITINREGFAYKDVILIPTQENGTTTYSGKIQGKQASFIVYENNTVEFQCGDKFYGPYVTKEDSSAIPKDSELGESMTGVELYNGNEIIFRGGVFEHADGLWLINEDGSLGNIEFSFTTSNGIEIDEDGNVIDQMEPRASEILELMAGPEMTHKGEWSAWFGGVIVCIVTAIIILFADELFHWNLSFQIRNVEQAEPSEWEIVGRYITWTMLTMMAIIIFITGLQ